MNKKFTKLIAALALLTVFALPMKGWAEEKTINAGPLTNGVLTDSPFTLTFAKNNGSTEPTYNATAGDLRLYAKGTVVVESTGGNMTTIVFNLSAQGKKRLAPITASVGTIATQESGDETVTWTGDAASVTFTVGDKAVYGSDGDSKAGQLCFGSVDITYTASGGSTTPSITISGNEISNNAASFVWNSYDNNVEYTASVVYDNMDIPSENVDIVVYSDAICQTNFADDYFHANFVNNSMETIEYAFNEDNPAVSPRTVYMRVEVMTDEDFIFSNLIAVTQAARPTYTVTFNCDGGTGCPEDVPGIIAGNSNNFMVPSDTPTKEHYTFDGFYIGSDDEMYEAGGSYTISSDLELTASWTVNTHNVTLPTANQFGTYSMNAINPVHYGTTVTLTYAPASGYETYSATWSVNGTTISGNSFPMPDEDVTVTVTCENVVVDELSGAQVYGAMQNSSSKTYKEWELTTTNGTTFVGNTNDSQDYIQMNTGSNRGIVSTVSIGKAKKVDVIFVNNTTNGRKITVYGKNTPYEGPSDLYDDDNKGTELGEIICGTNTEISISGDYMYIGLLASGALYVEPITITWEPVTTYEVVYQGSYTMSNVEIGTVEVSSANAIEGAEVTITATGHNHYHFSGWTVIDENESPIDLTGTNPATFIMPGSDVYVDATFAEDTKYTVSIDVDSEDYVLVDPVQTYAGETVQIQISDIPSGKILDEVMVTKQDQITVEVTYVGEEGAYSVYSFVMPENNVTVSVSIRDLANYTVSYYVLGVLDQTVVVTEGQNTTLPTTVSTDLGDYTLLGWMDENGTTVESPYTPNGNVSLYAALGTTSSISLTIDADTQNFPSSYGTANTFTEYTLEGKKFMIQQGYKKNDEILQWRAAGNSSGTGTMYNSENFGRITSIVLVYDASDSNKNFTIKAGTTANPTGGTSITPVVDNTYTFTFDLSNGQYTYFVMTNGSGAGYLTSITIYYEGITAATTMTVYDEEVNRSEDIENLEYVIVKDGGILNFTGFNNGTAANLIVEDGGQLYTDEVIEATIKKNITAYDPTLIGQGVSNGWYFISYPLNTNGINGDDPTSVTNMIASTPANYDLYELNGNTWENYKNQNHTENFFLQNGHGYLYANANGVNLEFAGSLNYRDLENDFVSLDNTGWNLVGNPFAYNTYPSMSYYMMNEAGTAIDATEYTTADAVPPCTGILVNNSGEGLITFSKAAPAKSTNGNLNILVAQEATNRGASSVADNAIVSFNEGSQLGKFYFGTQNANLYIPQGTEEYAIVSTEAQGTMPVNFRANENGTYTLTVNPENVEMNYLHLIDNMTGADIDLLANPSYSFNANVTDYESRFKLVFATNDEDGASTGSAAFAFYSNGNWIINNPSTGSGPATLQVVDLMGRILSSETVNGSVSKAINATPGVYMLRLINGENVKVQKIVVR